MAIPSDQLHPPRHDYIDRVMIDNNRPPTVLRNIQTLHNTGHLVGTRHLSILPVGQDVEHSTGASFAANPLYFDPRNIVELIIEAGCNYVVSIYGVLAPVSRRYAHRISFLVKLNYNEVLGYPDTYDQMLYVSMEQVSNMGTVAVGVTTYLGSEESCCQIEEVSAAFERAYELGMVIVLWAYPRSSVFKKDGVGYHVSADLTSQANHPTAIISIDIAEQEMAENSGGYRAINYGCTNNHVYGESASESPIDPVRYQLTNRYMSRTGLANPGGAAGGETDLSDAVRITVIDKRTDGMGLILRRKAFRESMANGVKLTSTVQDTYLDSKIIIA